MEGASAPPARLFSEDVDTLTLVIGTTIFAQQLLLKGEPQEARPVLRELINLAPRLLRATFDAWGYSRIPV